MPATRHPGPNTGAKPSRKELSHDRILDAAARAVRRVGYEGVGVADVMKEAGLTHGGFYAHFESREAMLSEAIAHAAKESSGAIRQRMAVLQKKGMSPFRSLVEAYLSDVHLAATEASCPVAALSSEIPRQTDEVRKTSCDLVRDLVTLAESVLPAGVERESALVVASTMVGTLQLARALGGEQGRAVLNANRKVLIAQYDPAVRAAH
jgi:AcrR family transcriptional regulator